jgi:uncharacterized membrane protein YdjX (TVP38/TMEM64 family)
MVYKLHEEEGVGIRVDTYTADLSSQNWKFQCFFSVLHPVSILRALAMISVFGFLGGFMYLFFGDFDRLAFVIQNVNLFVKTHPHLGLVSAAFLAVFAVILLCPLWPVGISAGIIFTDLYGSYWGILWGSIFGYVCTWLGCIGAFFVSKWIFRAMVQDYCSTHPRFWAIDNVVSKQGLKVSPVSTSPYFCRL